MASCENKYTTLLDLSRQAKVITGETACFDGKIEVGIPFSGYPTGVDTNTIVSLGVVSSETAVFSGNTGTTIFDVSNTGSTNYNALFSGYSGTVWTNVLFSGNTSGLTLPINTFSADTQIIGPLWYLTQTGMTGDYVIGTQYTGYSITYSFSQVEQMGIITGYTAYSGFSSASQENFSAGTLDYKGPLDYISSVEDASIDGRLTTNKLTVTDGASASTIGYVLTQLDDTGKAGWVYNSSTASTNTFVTGGTLNGTNLDLTWNTGGSVPSIELSGLTFTGNTSGDCISNLYLTNLYGCSPLHIEPSGVNDVYIVENGGNVGIGTTGATEKLHVSGGDILVSYNQDSNSKLSIENYNGGDDAFAQLALSVSGTSAPNAKFGSIMAIGPDSVPTGGFMGSYLPDSLNIITSNGTAASRMHINIGSRRTNGETRFFSGQDFDASNLVGVVYSTGLTITDMVNTDTLRVRNNGYVEGDLGIGTNTPAKKLHVNGDVIISGNPGLLELYYTSDTKTQIGQNTYGFLQFNRSPTTNEEEAFIVNYAASGNTVFRCGENGSAVDDVMVLYGSGNTVSNTELIFSGDSEPLIFGNGNLEVFGNIGIKQLPTGAAVKDVHIDAQGKLTDNASDERLKENVLTLNNSLSKLLQLSGVSYNWIDRNSGSDDTFYGFIAQQLEKVDSNLTFTNENSGYMGIKSNCITPLIVESIKEIYNNPSIPNYTPTSSGDTYGNVDNITTDDYYLYVKTNNGWKRTSLESF